MQKKIFIIFFAFCFGAVLLSSCRSDTLVPVISIINPNQPISYATGIQPIFTANCLTCHNGGQVTDLLEGKSYSALMSLHLIDTVTPTQSTLYKKIATGGSMHSYVTADQIQTILIWIQQGAKNN